MAAERRAAERDAPASDGRRPCRRRGAVPRRPAAARRRRGRAAWSRKPRACWRPGGTDVWDALSRRFESRLILTALANTRGRRIEAAQKLGIGRNTITRKIQELGLE